MSASLLFDRVPIYEYRPLDPSRREFRLIRLLPPKSTLIPGCSNILRLQIVEADIDDDDCQAYDAISYLWVVSSTQKPNRRVLVENENEESRRLYIHRPLEEALLNLQSSGVARLPLFADQLCINQGSSAEKEHQVGLMKDIYANCNSAIIWLGPATRHSDLWFNYSREICNEGTLLGLVGPRVASFLHVFDAVMDPAAEVDEHEARDRDALLSLIRLHGKAFPFSGFMDVLDRNWSRRLWVIQEACLAPRVIITCGQQVLDYDSFRASLLFYNIYNTHWVGSLKEAHWNSEYKRRDDLLEKSLGFRRIIQERKAIHQTGSRQALYDLILKYNVNGGSGSRHRLGTSLAEDRIYGILGLAAEDDDLRRRVRVRYDLNNPAASVSRAFTEIAALMLAERRDTLLYSQFPKTASGLPSWVPDWSMDLMIPVGYSAPKSPSFSSSANFAAGGDDTTSPFHVDEQDGRLTIRGFLIDTVVLVGDRTHSVNPLSKFEDGVDYRDTSLFFDELAGIIREAADHSAVASYLSGDEAAQTQLLLRVFDAGLSHQHYTETFGPEAGVEKLGATQRFIDGIGKGLLRSDAFAASYSIARIYQTVGITPWYFIPPPESDTRFMCAQSPTQAGRVALDAVRDFVEDVVGLCLAAARVKLASYRIWFRARFAKTNLTVEQEAFKSLGFPEDFWETREERTAFCNNILRNVGRRAYRTANGRVGTGPSHMRPGDCVVVFYGSTMAHLLRAKKSSADGPPGWDYLGEAYCDGVMHGEALASGVARDFVLA